MKASEAAAASPKSLQGDATGGVLERPATQCAFLLLAGVIFLWTQLPYIDAALKLTLPDSDDALRLQGVRDLLAGQGWFDNTQYRYLPPAGASLHWSRLVDAPLAALIRVLTPLLGMRPAEGAVAAFWPLGLFLLYLSVLGAVAWRAFGLIAVGFGALFAAQSLVLADIFGAGRIDHHNIEAVLILAAAGCVAFAERSGRMAAVGGALAGLSLAVSLETLPFVAALAALLGLYWAFADQRAPFTGFAAALAAASLTTFAVQTAPAQWPLAACDALSAPWLLLTTGGALAALVVTRAGTVLTSLRARLVVLAVAGALIASTFVFLFPACLGGPYHMVPEPFRTMWLDAIPEANTLRQILARNPGPTLQAFGPLSVAAGIAAFVAWRGHDETRRMMIVLAAMLWTGLLLCLVQVRVIYVVSPFIPLVAAWALTRLVRLANAPSTRGHAIALAGAAVLLLGSPWSIAANLARNGTAFASTPISAIERGCLADRYIRPLNQLQKGLVLAPIDLGTHLLLLTHHSIIAAGYHRAADGIVVGIEAFNGSEADMRRYAERYGADYIVLCPAWIGVNAAQPFALALVQDKSVPWLEPIAVPGPLKAWRVRLR
jgi:hypothetical protein